MRNVLHSVALLLVAFSLGVSAPVTLEAFDPPTYPHFIGPGSPNFETFFFAVPDFNPSLNISSMHIRAEVYDDGPRDRPEGFRLVLDVPGPNFDLASFNADLGGSLGALDGASAYAVEHSFSSSEIALAREVLGITNGLLIVRVNRNEGDFYLNDLVVTADVGEVPEPSTFGVAGAAIATAALARRRR